MLSVSFFRHWQGPERVSLRRGEGIRVHERRLDGSDGVGNDGIGQVGEEKAHTLYLATSGAPFANGRLHHHCKKDSFSSRF